MPGRLQRVHPANLVNLANLANTLLIAGLRLTMLTDLRYAIRSLARSKGFSLLVVLSLGFALGLCTTMYAIVDAVLYPHLPYKDPNRIAMVRALQSVAGSSLERFEAIQSLNIHEQIAAFSRRQSLLEVGTTGEYRTVTDVTPEFFRVLGIEPALGRDFASDRDPVEETALIVSDDLWRRYFPGRRSLTGAVIRVDGQPHAVIGVLPPDASFPYQTDAWRAASLTALAGSGPFGLTPLLRLRHATSEGEVRAALRIAASRLRERFHGSPGSFRFDLVGLRASGENLQAIHTALLGSSILLLLIASANLANLMLARGLGRRREVALRLTLGASRTAVARQLAAESVLLVVAGGALGMFAAAAGSGLSVHWLPQTMEYVGTLRPQLSWRVFGAGILATGITMILFGLIPAWRASRVDLSEPLKDSAGTTTGRTRRYSLLVVVEVALSVVLLLGTGLVVEEVRTLRNFDMGYDLHGLYQVPVNLTARRPEGAGVLDDRALPAIQRIRGVTRAAATTRRNAEGGVLTSDLPGSPRTAEAYSYQAVSVDYLRTMGIPIVAGRDFETGDREGDAVAVVDQATARWLWPGIDPVGRMLKLGEPRADRPWIRVVGVAREHERAPDEALDGPPRNPKVYVISRDEAVRSRTYVVRAAFDEAAVAVALPREIRTALSLSSYPTALSWIYWLEQWAAARRFLASLFAALAGVALLLTAIGLYCVSAYAVSQRLREFAVRVALGAGHWDLFRLVLHDGFFMVAAGTALGTVLTLGTAKILRALLSNINPTSTTISLVIAGVLLGATALAACLLPARRATRANPVEILRAV